MYKMQIPRCIKYFLFSCICVCSIIFLGIQKCFAVDILDKSLNKLDKNIDHAASKKAVVKDIYKSSLNQFHYTQLQVLSDAVSYVKVLVNDIYSCNLKDNDIINILYYSNEWFQRDIDTMTVYSITKPTNDDMKSSCGKFNICAWKMKWQIWNSPENGWYRCLTKISNLYEEVQLNKKSISTLTNNIEWNEYFWNGTLDDSTYDLLVDVYDVAKILFGKESATQPPEVVFFDMPDINNADGVYSSDDQTTIVDRFSPYNTTVWGTTSVNQWGTTNTNTTTSSNNWRGSSAGWELSLGWNSQSSTSKDDITQNSVQKDEIIHTNLNEWMDDDIYNFIETVNTLSTESQNVATVSLWNQCVSGFSYQFKTWYTITDTGISVIYGSDEEQEVKQQQAEEYVVEVLQQIHALQCNNDFVCDSWESTTCEDCIPMSSGTTVVSEVEDLINSMTMQEWEEVSQQTLSCVNKCHGTQDSVESLLLCVAKCFCTTYESSFFDPTKFPGLSPVFKIKFCVIPATEVQKSNEKIVRSIQSVFDVMYDLVADLKYGWETMPTVKTKTYLDSSYMKNSFGKKISFLITSRSKRHVNKVSKKSKEKTQENFNTELSTTVLQQSEDPSDLDEKNKYVVAQDKYVWRSGDMEILWRQIHESLQNDIIISAGTRFNEFMRLNENFWVEVKDILDDFNVQAKQLKNK